MAKPPKWFAVTLVIVGLIIWIIPKSVAIPFIYENRYFLSSIISYIGLATLFYLYIAVADVSVYRKNSKREKAELLLGLSIMPLMFGFTLSLLIPITANLLASEGQVREYRFVEAKPYAKRLMQISELTVLDKASNSIVFIMRNENLAILNLEKGDLLTLTGRNCIVGFVVDNVSNNSP